MVSKAGVQDLTGLAGTGENIQGEEQKKLDILSNDVFKDKLTKTGCMVCNFLDNLRGHGDSIIFKARARRSSELATNRQMHANRSNGKGSSQF